MRRMSFSMTKRQYLDHSKDVTRRLGWLFLVGCKPGEEHFMGVEKGMGLKKGQKQVELGPSGVLSARREPLWAITDEDVLREGFPDKNRDWLIDFFCRANSCRPDTMVTRIEYKQEFPAVVGAPVALPDEVTREIEL
jgi:hypothetical protein